MSAIHRQIAAHNRFVGEAACERGAANEARLLDAVLALRAGGASWILDGRRATPEEDAAGADVVVTTDAGALYLQSKSSRAGLAKFAAKARTIRVEAVVVSLDDATTRARALAALEALRRKPAPAPPSRAAIAEDRQRRIAALRVQSREAREAIRKAGCFAKALPEVRERFVSAIVSAVALGPGSCWSTWREVKTIGKEARRIIHDRLVEASRAEAAE